MRPINKKGQGVMNAFVALTLGVIVFAVVLAIGLTVLSKLSASSAISSDANTSVVQLITELGTTSGLGSWIGIVIIAVVGFLIIGFFVRRRA